MQFKHSETDNPALMVDTKPFMDDALKIEKPSDLPSIPFWESVGCLPPEIVQGQGLTGIDSWLKAFINYPDIYYISIFPSGFPNGIVPKFTRG